MSPASTTLRQTLDEGGEITSIGQIAWSSNETFLVELNGDEAVRGVYKPEAGERPLGDFPSGIWRREVAAYELAQSLGWDCIPETVTVDGPYGRGSLQLFVDVDYALHYFTMIDEHDAALDSQLRRLCCFDLVANNTDRKAGHCLLDRERHIWGIDNALCFHAYFKLRTVIWDFAGEPIPSALLEDLASFLDADLSAPLRDLLDPFERDALRTRAAAIVSDGYFPYDSTGRRYPWPLI